MLFEGYSQNAVWAVTSIGIDPSTGEELYLDKDDQITNKWASSNKVYQGVSQPTFNGNLNSVFTYKDFTLNLSFGYYWGGVQYNSTLLNKVEVTLGSLSENVDKRVLYDRWYEPGDVKYFKAISDTSTKMSSRYIFDDNVFSLQSASASYRLRLNNEYVNTIDLGVNMSDIFYISSIEREREEQAIHSQEEYL